MGCLQVETHQQEADDASDGFKIHMQVKPKTKITLECSFSFLSFFFKGNHLLNINQSNRCFKNPFAHINKLTCSKQVCI